MKEKRRTSYGKNQGVVPVIEWTGVSPGHESANLGPSALCNEKSDNGVSHCTPGFTNEQHHGGLDSVDLERWEGNKDKSKYIERIQKIHMFSLLLSCLTSAALPERCRAGRFAGRRPWRWRPPPWALRRWRSTACCIATTSGPARSVETEVTNGEDVY